MLEYNQIRERKYIVLDGDPYEVISSHVFRKQQRKPINNVKIKHMVSGRVTERSFGSSEKAEEADVTIKKIKYLYSKIRGGGHAGEYWFSAENDPSDRFTLPETMVEETITFTKQNDLVEALVFNEEVIGLRTPLTVTLKVTEAEPAVKGNTATGANKRVTMETGLILNTPLFINEGDVLKINTVKREYIERA
ncbi:hypothetical protein COB55_00545 [Candidatus Wolfebacteria bacterium]|nr:MAG: hypothetical protein COB55_00545 [Candidatus Wolfebacteria bacterium]